MAHGCSFAETCEKETKSPRLFGGSNDSYICILDFENDVVDVRCLAMFVARKGVVQIQPGLQTVLQEVPIQGTRRESK